MIGAKNAGATSYTWTGGSTTSNNWSDKNNWGGSGYPSAAADAATISNVGSRQPTLDVAVSITSLTIKTTGVILTLSGNLTLSGALTINSGFGLSIPSGSNNTISTGSVSVIASGSLTVGANNNITVSGTFTLGSSAVLSNSGTISNATTTVTSGTTYPLDNTSTGTFTTTNALGLGSGCILTNEGHFNTNGGASLSSGAAIVNSSTGNFKSVGDITLPSTAYISNSGIFDSNGGTFDIQSSAYISNNTGGTFYIYGNAAVNFSKSGAYISNAGTFYAGKSNTSCTFNLSSSTTSITNTGTFYGGQAGCICTFNLSNASSFIKNTGNFYLGSTSVINVTKSGATVANKSPGVFTIQSDANGSGTIGPVTGTNAFTGIFKAERYLSGGSSAYRNYRLLSSPVYDSIGTSTPLIYSINYVAAVSPTTGSGGTGGGFTKSGNPSFYLYRDNLAPSNLSFTGGNFRGIKSISGSPSYTLDNEALSYTIPVGNGFMFFDRGNTSNLTSKFTPGTAAESITLTASGNITTGNVVVTPWFTPATAKLDYTSVTGNGAVIGFALVGNPYASSIDWDKFGTSITGTITANTIYVFDPVLGKYNVYKAGTAGGAGNLVTSGSNIIPSGQGFFVKASASAAFTFTENAKTNTQVTSGLTGNLLLGPPPQQVVSQYFNVRLMQDSIHYDGTLVMFNSSATTGYVLDEDAEYKPGSGALSVWTASTDQVSLAINQLPLPSLKQTSIPLVVDAPADGVYQLTMPAIKSIPDLYDIWLMDAYSKDSLDFKHNPSYSFNVYKSDTGSFGSNRFKLVVRQNQALMVHLLNFTATKATDGSEIVWKTENEANYTSFTIERSTDGGVTYNVVGGVASSALGTYSLLDKNPLANAANQYRLAMQDLNGATSYSNVVTLIYGNSNTVSSNLRVFPNPSGDVLNLAIQQNSSSGQIGIVQGPVVTYNIKIIGITGSIVKSATSASPNWSGNVGDLMPGTYIIQVINNSNNKLIGTNTFVKL